MHILDLEVPSFNQWQALQRFYLKPGFVVQKIRGLEQQILALKVPSKAVKKLTQTLARLSESKVKAQDNTGVAHIIHSFLVKALTLQHYCSSVANDLSTLLSPMRPATPKQQTRSWMTPVTAQSLTSSPSKSIGKLVKQAKPNESQVKTAVPAQVTSLTADQVFESDNSKLIDLFMKQQQLDLANLRGTRNRAEWNDLRRHSMLKKSAKELKQAEEIEFASQLRKRSQELLLKQKAQEEKERHEAVKDRIAFMRSHKKEVALRSKPHYSRSTSLHGLFSPEEQLMSNRENSARRTERMSSLRHAYQSIVEQKRVEEQLLQQFYS
jgi:hypothetical protein